MAAKTATEKELAQLRDDFNALRSDLQQLLQVTLQDGKKKISTVANDVTDQGKALAEQVETQIRERPLQTVLTAFGIGYLLGKVLQR